MGLASEMKNLSEELLASFKQRIQENEELVNDVQKTLDGFRKDHLEMSSVINANAMALRKGLAQGEKERLHTFNDLMAGIHRTISSIQTEVMDIQKSTFNMINEFASDRNQMAAELTKFFADEKADRDEDEKTRLLEFDAMMKNINDEIRSINEEVLAIFENTNAMLDEFEKEHHEMSADLKSALSKNLAERVEYTRKMLNGFQKRLSEIGKENQKMAQKLRKDLASGETSRLTDYKGLMKDIHTSIKEIRKEVMNIKQTSSGLIGYYAKDRSEGAAEWNKMQDTIAQLRETGLATPPKATAKKVEKVEKTEAKAEPKVEVKAEEPVVAVAPVEEIPVEVAPKAEPKPAIPLTLEEKILAYIGNHPKGVRVSEMEEPLGETRMKLGFVAKNLLDEGKVQKVENIYFPIK